MPLLRPDDMSVLQSASQWALPHGMMAGRAIFLWIIAAAGLSPATTAAARDSLGVFESWGAFRDPVVPRCYAIAQPAKPGADGRWGASVTGRRGASVTGRRGASVTGRWRPFASVGYWPRANIRGQIHIRLSREMADRSPLTLSIGERQFTLVGSGADAWARDRQGDAAIVAAMRSATSMSLSARSRTGAGFADTYRLRGAATAIDAAALGCGRMR